MLVAKGVFSVCICRDSGGDRESKGSEMVCPEGNRLEFTFSDMEVCRESRNGIGFT